MSQPPRSAHQLLADYGLSEGVIRGVLHIHAHQLAEQQRDHAEQQWPGDDSSSVLRRVVAGHTADLIDPEVQR